MLTALSQKRKSGMQSALTTPVGVIGITCENEQLVNIHFLPANTSLSPPKSKIAIAAHEQIKRYFENPNFCFSLPLHPSVSKPFAIILRHLQIIPPGETRRYGEIALLAGTSPRVVGNACRRNPIPIIIPCHRVISRKGLGGYFGETNGDNLEIKRQLLQHEGYLKF